MNLINADDLIKDLQNANLSTYNQIIDYIANYKTSFDFTRVIGQLKELQDRAINVKDFDVSTYATGMMQKALKIVKDGAINNIDTSNFNTIIFKKGYKILTREEFRNFDKGDTIWGKDASPEILKYYSMGRIDEAKKALEDCYCKYKYFPSSGCYVIYEYVLEYCECNKYRDFIDGSTYEFAKEKS